MEKVKHYIAYTVLGAIFAISSAMLSIQLIIPKYYSFNNIIFTGVVSFFCSIWFLKKTSKKTFLNAKNNILFTIICIILTYIVMAQLYVTKGIEYKQLFKEEFFNPFRIRYFILSFLSAIYFGIYIGNKIKKWIGNLYYSLDTWDKKAYIVATVVSFICIVIAYSSNANWYLQYDKVYSLDSGWCINNIFSDITYYDVRHPILNIFTFPIWAIVSTISNMLLPGNLSTVVIAIVLQIINAQLLILIGIQLKILTQNKWTFILYMVSFQTILYTLFFEKYQLCTFLLVLYVFTICNRKERTEASLIASAGAMPTSCFIGVAELFTSDKLWIKIKKITKIIVMTIFIFICLGRGHMIQYGISEMIEQKNTFSNKTYSMKEKVVSTTKIFQGSLMSLQSKVTDNHKYLWDGLEKEISVVAIGMMIVMIIGGIHHRKELFTKIAATWCMFAIILFVFLNWSTHETPLFAIYFSWAIIPLFVMGIDWIIQKVKANQKLVYTLITSVIVIINIITMFDIQKFLYTL